jgi:hypothetical protein
MKGKSSKKTDPVLKKDGENGIYCYQIVYQRIKSLG